MLIGRTRDVGEKWGTAQCGGRGTWWDPASKWRDWPPAGISGERGLLPPLDEGLKEASKCSGAGGRCAGKRREFESEGLYCSLSCEGQGLQLTASGEGVSSRRRRRENMKKSLGRRSHFVDEIRCTLFG